ncbi:MAG: S24 family peptidase [Azonexus sp.]|jgi:SOS-response transcriptional repressor LexA|nr:S24 family peptidase [Azonexus sp.]
MTSREQASRPLTAIPVRAASGCEAAGVFALQVLGDAMLPEFAAGDIIVIEPEGLAEDGSFVVARQGGQWTFRQLLRDGDGWCLAALNPAYGRAIISDLSAVRGVVIQKSRPGRRRSIKHYVD